MKTVTVGALDISNDRPFTLISGPCQLETLDHARMLAGTLAEMTAALGIGYVFKASFDKANRSSGRSPRGPGMQEGLDHLATLRDELRCPVTSDVHEPAQCEPASKVLDMLQIPAFLCRQTDLLAAASDTGRPAYATTCSGSASARKYARSRYHAPWFCGSSCTQTSSFAFGNCEVAWVKSACGNGYCCSRRTIAMLSTLCSRRYARSS